MVRVPASQTFHKALLQLDRGRFDDAETSLRLAIEQADTDSDQTTWASASCCLGDLLVQTGRPADGEPILQQVAALDPDDDILGFEIRRATELLRGLHNN